MRRWMGDRLLQGGQIEGRWMAIWKDGCLDGQMLDGGQMDGGCIDGWVDRVWMAGWPVDG